MTDKRRVHEQQRPGSASRGLSSEATRLTRLLHALLPDEGEVAGLLALMLLTDARRAARTGASGELIPLVEQDRTLWDRRLISEGIELVSRVLPRGAVGPYQLQAAIAAVHDEAPRAADTDWPQILALYTLLQRSSERSDGLNARTRRVGRPEHVGLSG